MMRPWTVSPDGGSVVLWTVGLLGGPEDEICSPVADVAADLEASRSAAEVAPVAQGAFGDAEEEAGLLQGEHLVAGVAARVWGWWVERSWDDSWVIATVGSGSRTALPQQAGAQGLPIDDQR